MSQKTTVGIIDNHPLLLLGFKTLIQSTDNFELILTASNGKEFQDKILANPDNEPQIILLKLKLQQLDGIETTEWLIKHNPNAKVIAFNGTYPKNTKHRMIVSGCIGFLYKSDSLETIINALNEVVKFGKISNSKIKIKDFVYPNIVFKDRQWEVLQLACTELTTNEIAHKLFLSTKSIENYIHVLCGLFQVKNRYGLIRKAILDGWILV